MADPFRNELEGAMARADRAEREAVRLRQELAAAKAPIAPAAPADTTPFLLVGVVILLVLAAVFAVGIGLTVRAPAAVPNEPAVEAPWSQSSSAVTSLQRLGSQAGVSLANFECRPILAANDPRAFMCRGYANEATRETLTSKLGMGALPASVKTPEHGCAALPMYRPPGPVVRYAGLGAAASPKPSDAEIQVLYTRTGTNDVCFEIDYVGK